MPAPLCISVHTDQGMNRKAVRADSTTKLMALIPRANVGYQNCAPVVSEDRTADFSMGTRIKQKVLGGLTAKPCAYDAG